MGLKRRTPSNRLGRRARESTPEHRTYVYAEVTRLRGEVKRFEIIADGFATMLRRWKDIPGSPTLQKEVEDALYTFERIPGHERPDAEEEAVA